MGLLPYQNKAISKGGMTMTKKKIFAGIGALAVAIIGVGIVVTQVLS